MQTETTQETKETKVVTVPIPSSEQRQKARRFLAQSLLDVATLQSMTKMQAAVRMLENDILTKKAFRSAEGYDKAIVLVLCALSVPATRHALVDAQGQVTQETLQVFWRDTKQHMLAHEKGETPHQKRQAERKRRKGITTADIASTLVECPFCHQRYATSGQTPQRRALDEVSAAEYQCLNRKCGRKFKQ